MVTSKALSLFDNFNQLTPYAVGYDKVFDNLSRYVDNSVTSTATSSDSSGGLQTGTYKGFSTLTSDKSNQLFDLDLIKQDLVNHFYTRKGERVMNPNFGSVIWDMLYEPLDEHNKELIVEIKSRNKKQKIPNWYR